MIDLKKLKNDKSARPYVPYIGIRLKPGLKEELVQLCRKNHLSVTRVVGALVEEFVAANKNPRGKREDVNKESSS